MKKSQESVRMEMIINNRRRIIKDARKQESDERSIQMEVNDDNEGI